ncbi:hypothetical protein [Xanthomonas sp. XNM01]|uniref:hypothetical protein n=1 Tax=Xanthomonas sp. XNM01 TaxID=2769289 RepID=UPI00177E40A0|nr:hypothetical protein [Xanthomonas sp. XNM01]MBD9368824.1 hypothetical protein [Xanthomonas sp. XNM01]
MHLQPVVRRALLAAHASQGHTLRRTRGGFAGLPAQVRTSAPVQVETFTRRAVNWLREAALAEFDSPTFPSAVTLNARGVAEAERLRAADQAKAGAA